MNGPTVELVQGSVEWLAARAGCFGASELGALMAKGEGKTRAKLIRQKAAERLTGKPQGWEGNAATESGHEQEPHAVLAYEALTNSFVSRVGLVKHARLANSHASPDGIVDGVRGLEIKSHVRFVTHLEAIEGSMPTHHIYQVQWGMACTGLPEWDYGHYCHEAPEHLRLHLFPRVKRDDALIATLFAAVQQADAEVEAIVNKYRSK